MSKWFFSLQFRLIVGFALVLAITLGSISLYIGYAAKREVAKVEQELERVRAARVERLVSQYYEVQGDWKGLQPILERASSLYSRHFVVTDEDGNVVGDSLRRFGHPFRKGKFDVRPAPLHRSGRQIGALLVGPSDAPEGLPEPRLTRFADAINRALLWAGAAAGAGAVLMVSLVSGRALSSVSVLSSVARQLGRGDLSQRVPERGRDEVAELGRTFNAMADDLESAENQRRHLVADVAHELRTPLSNVQGYVEAVRDGVLEPDATTVKTIHQQVMYLAHLVDDLRLLAETEAQDFHLDISPDSLEGVIDRSVEAFRPRAEAKGVTLATEVPPDLPLVEMDRTRITQVVGNLLENAVRHTPSGGEVSLSVRIEDAALARVTVADSGEGISPQALAHVFDRFYRVDPSRTRTTGGAGLGLTIAQHLVQAHGGSIRAASTTGKGSRFIFDLPLVQGAGGEGGRGQES